MDPDLEEFMCEVSRREHLARDAAHRAAQSTRQRKGDTRRT
jgi:hypothetical protein